MHTFVEVFRWLTDGSHWHGSNGIPIRALEHLELTFAAVALAMAIALPLGMFIGHTRRGAFLSTSIANVGRAVPSFAILVIAFTVIVRFAPTAAFGFFPALVALFLLAIPPMLTNTYVGIQGVDRDTVEAARGMGMTGSQILLRLELPLAVPVILAGIRTAVLQVVATATLSALIGGGTLGRYIVDGLATNDTVQTVAGAVLIVVLSLSLEAVMAGVQRASSPRVSSSGRRRRATAAGPGIAPAIER